MGMDHSSLKRGPALHLASLHPLDGSLWSEPFYCTQDFPSVSYLQDPGIFHRVFPDDSPISATTLKTIMMQRRRNPANMGEEIGLLPRGSLLDCSYGTPELGSETGTSQGHVRASGSDPGSVCSGLEEGLAHHHPVPV